jgi:hypothetical protein
MEPIRHNELQKPYLNTNNMANSLECCFMKNVVFSTLKKFWLTKLQRVYIVLVRGLNYPRKLFLAGPPGSAPTAASTPAETCLRWSRFSRWASASSAEGTLSEKIGAKRGCTPVATALTTCATLWKLFVGSRFNSTVPIYIVQNVCTIDIVNDHCRYW